MPRAALFYFCRWRVKGRRTRRPSRLKHCQSERRKFKMSCFCSDVCNVWKPSTTALASDPVLA